MLINRALRAIPGQIVFSASRGLSSTVAVTPATLRASADRMLDYYIARQQPDGSLEGCDDPCHYCKLPNALVWGGRTKEADAMLDFCKERFMQPNGDFSLRSTDTHFAPLEDKTLHW